MNVCDTTTFIKPQHYKQFIEILQETVVNYGLRIHVFCILKNRYDLLVSTPYANLSTAMRHINSLFTQYVNRQRESGGAVFRGRFKSVLIEPEYAALPVSRYIHLLPQQTRASRRPHEYKWCSLSSYIDNGLAGYDFLDSGALLKFAPSPRKFDYATYLQQGIDEPTHRFYSKKNLRSILSSMGYLKNLQAKKRRKTAIKKTTLSTIARETASHFKVAKKTLNFSQRGPSGGNIPRAVAMMTARQVGHYSLKEIAEYFDIEDVSTVSVTIKRLKSKMLDRPALQTNVNSLVKKLSGGRQAARHKKQ